MYGQSEEVSSNNPRNRFMFCFCRSSEVDEGWGFQCLGCRTCPFYVGIVIFGLIYSLGSAKDIIELAFFSNPFRKNIIYRIFFICKLISDLFCILGTIVGLTTIRSNSYKSAVTCYYMIMTSFILNNFFCIYIIVAIITGTFLWFAIFWNVFSIIFWAISDYFLLIYCWLCFCNMVDINRKGQSGFNNSFS